MLKKWTVTNFKHFISTNHQTTHTHTVGGETSTLPSENIYSNIVT